MCGLLDMDKINALTHPLYAYIGRDTWWPVDVIDVETGAMRIDVCGKLDNLHFCAVLALRDADGVEHDTDDFYNEETP